VIAAPPGARAYFDLKKTGGTVTPFLERDDGSAVGSLPVVGFDDDGDAYVIVPFRHELVRCKALRGYAGLGLERGAWRPASRG
jgi:hypothetical protein